MELKTNDGTIVNTKWANEKHKGVFKKGRISSTLYHDPRGGYYLVDHLEKTVEWCCKELAIDWFKNNGIWELPKRLR